jgi:riboflavin biosynthesis pyrimidine reductase
MKCDDHARREGGAAAANAISVKQDRHPGRIGLSGQLILRSEHRVVRQQRFVRHVLVALDEDGK